MLLSFEIRKGILKFIVWGLQNNFWLSVVIEEKPLIKVSFGKVISFKFLFFIFYFLPNCVLFTCVLANGSYNLLDIFNNYKLKI